MVGAVSQAGGHWGVFDLTAMLQQLGAVPGSDEFAPQMRSMER